MNPLQRRWSKQNDGAIIWPIEPERVERAKLRAAALIKLRVQVIQAASVWRS